MDHVASAVLTKQTYQTQQRSIILHFLLPDLLTNVEDHQLIDLNLSNQGVLNMATLPQDGTLTQWRDRGQQLVFSFATKLYNWRAPRKAQSSTLDCRISVVCISDTHNTQPDLPPGDILVHAGDLSHDGTFSEIQAQLDWLNEQPHQHKVVISGNHDYLLDPECEDRCPEHIVERPGASRSDLRWGSIIYLQDTSATLRFVNGRSLRIYGSPWTQQYGTRAFQFPLNRDVWTGAVPIDTDILITHGPPKFHLDANAQGNQYLVYELCRVRPKLVVYGHIHDGYGKDVVDFNDIQAAYERIRGGDKVAPYLFTLLYCVLTQRIRHLLRGKDEMKTNRGAGTCLVNASAVCMSLSCHLFLAHHEKLTFGKRSVFRGSKRQDPDIRGLGEPTDVTHELHP